MKKKEKNSERIPIKNYIIVIIMFAVSILIVVGLRGWYRNYKKYRLTIPVISGKIQEIKLNEFDSYITSHENAFIYIGTASNRNCRDIEEDLVFLLKKRNIKNDTVYINMTDMKENELTKILKKYEFVGNVNYPMFIMINDKKVVAAVKREGSKLTIGDITQLLDEHEIG